MTAGWSLSRRADLAMSRIRDWNPGAYERFRDLRLRPAMDLLSAVGALPDGPCVDLGCGAGAAGAALKERCTGRTLIGVDSSPAMLSKAQETGAYDRLVQADVSDWVPDDAPALIFSNAVLNWLSEHTTLLPRLARLVAPGGWFAMQVPGQNDAPSHRLWRDLTGQSGVAGVLDPVEYADLLMPLGPVDVWETRYVQCLPASNQGHPVRRFTESTYGRQFLDSLDDAGRTALVAAYDAAIEAHYPTRADGTVLFPFRRVFAVLQQGM